MTYPESHNFFRELEEIGYRPFYASYNNDFGDLLFFTNSARVLIMQNQGQHRGFKIYHSSYIPDLVGELIHLRQDPDLDRDHPTVGDITPLKTR